MSQTRSKAKTQTILKVKVIPQASRNQIEYMKISENLTENSIIAKIRLIAQAKNNEANNGLIDFLSKKLKLRKSSMEIIQGHKNREKTLIFYDMNIHDVMSLYRDQQI